MKIKVLSSGSEGSAILQYLAADEIPGSAITVVVQERLQEGYSQEWNRDTWFLNTRILE